MKQFLSTLPQNTMVCFKGRMLLWQLCAMLLTLILVASGTDRNYFLATRKPELLAWMFPAVHIGGLLPITLPLLLIALGGLGKSAKTSLTGWALAQAEVIGAIIAAAYKAFTGRAHPSHSVGLDLTRTFRFGFLRGGVFWGWPSSHTTIAFAMAVMIFTLFPRSKWLGYLAIAYAFYIGIGVSMTIHWFSDFVAGAIFGSIVGMIVGKHFLLTPQFPDPTRKTESVPSPA